MLRNPISERGKYHRRTFNPRIIRKHVYNHRQELKQSYSFNSRESCFLSRQHAFILVVVQRLYLVKNYSFISESFCERAENEQKTFCYVARWFLFCHLDREEALFNPNCRTLHLLEDIKRRCNCAENGTYRLSLGPIRLSTQLYKNG